ncbi:hypothetical protein [Fodinicola acaciae]|uniref:hypothetical protein n=1 Tax=Fodinicola acaciae TaxID=2681555 RepID=UPI0013D2A2EA|nr:hypothetical protein [Fodinicola acaciae]
MPVESDQDLVHTVGPRGVVAPLVIVILAVPLGVFAGTLIVGSGPVDFWFATVLSGTIFALLLVTSALPYSLLAKKRARFTSSGIGAGPTMIPWSDVSALDAVPTLAGYRVRVTRRRGQPIDLLAPASLWWRRDERFDREAAELRAYAGRHGAVLDQRPVGRKPLLARLAVVLVLVVVVALAAGVRLEQRGWFSLWTPEARGIPEACAALDAAGLDQLWPPGHREKDSVSAGVDSSTCVWSATYSGQPEPYTNVRVIIERSRSQVLWSASAVAHTYFAQACRLGVTTTGFGDESCVGSQLDPTTLVVRQANVVVRVGLTGDRASQRTAEAIARKVLQQISR